MKWASWAVVFIALWLIVSPWALDYRDRTATAEDVIAGAVVWMTGMFAAGNEGSRLHWLIVGLGCWLVVTPWVLGYVNVSPAVTNDAAVGFLVMICAIIRWVAMRAADTLNRPG